MNLCIPITGNITGSDPGDGLRASRTRAPRTCCAMKAVLKHRVS